MLDEAYSLPTRRKQAKQTRSPTPRLCYSGYLPCLVFGVAFFGRSGHGFPKGGFPSDSFRLFAPFRLPRYECVGRP